MTTTTFRPLPLSASFRQRAAAALFSTMITLAMLAGNLNLAQGYAQNGATTALLAQSQPVAHS